MLAAAAHGHSNRVTGGYQSDSTSVMFSASRSLLAANEAPQPSTSSTSITVSAELHTHHIMQH